MIEKEKGIWSEFAEEGLEEMEWQENGLPIDFTDKYHDEEDEAA